MNLPDPPEGFRWRIRRVALLGYTVDYLALLLEPDTLWRRIMGECFSSGTIAAKTATDQQFESAAKYLLDRYRVREVTEPNNMKKYIGIYPKG